MTKKIEISPELLKRLYHEEKMVLKRLGEIFHVSSTTIRNRMAEHGITRRKPGYIPAKINHKMIVVNELIKLKNKGFKVIPLHGGPTPDGILIDFDTRRVYAVEVERRHPSTKRLKKYADTTCYDDIIWIVKD